MPETETALHELTAAQAARLIRAREVSPVDLVQALLARSADIDQSLQAWVRLDAARALAAGRLQRRGRVQADLRPHQQTRSFPVGLEPRPRGRADAFGRGLWPVPLSRRRLRPARSRVGRSAVAVDRPERGTRAAAARPPA